MMVKRGPQLVQLMKGKRYRRSAGSLISRRQSGQMPMSGEISVFRSAWRSLSMIRKSEKP